MRPRSFVPKLPALLAVLVGVVLLVAACTGGSAQPDGSNVRPSPSPQAGPSATSSGPVPIVLDAVATTSGPFAADDASYLTGMRLGIQDANAAGGVNGRSLSLAVSDDRGDPAEATQVVSDLAGRGPAAILYVGPGTALAPLRYRLEQTGTPVVLLQGDLYTSKELFRQVFQTTTPWAWQANVLARYLVTDRHAKSIGFAGSGPEAAGAVAATRSALSYWGGSLAWSATYDAGTPAPASIVARAAGADAVVDFGAPGDGAALAAALGHASSHPPQVAGSEALLAAPARPLPGTVACYVYTWAGWAEPIPRVARFMKEIQGGSGRLLHGFEQEGYDALMTLVHGLKATAGKGGSKLIDALEATPAATLSSFPIDLGPDDQLFLPRDELGLFAVAARDEKLDPWETPGSEPWRPIMRTFTYDGKRTSVPDLDRPVFFPWNPKEPGPDYWRSRYGISTRPSDPIH